MDDATKNMIQEWIEAEYKKIFKEYSDSFARIFNNEETKESNSTMANESKNTDGKTKEPSIWEKKDVQIARFGSKIILPSDPKTMSTKEAIDVLKRVEEQERQKVSIYEEVECFPLEGAWALGNVLMEKYGYTMNVSTMGGFFGMQEIPPTLVNLEVGVGKQDQVIWGAFRVPGLKAELNTSVGEKRGRVIFVISGEAPKGEQAQIKEIADLVRSYVSKNSLYKAQAIKISTTESKKQSGRYEVDISNPPSFIDLSRVNEEELVFSDDVMALIDTNIFTPIKHTALCREAQIPLKRSSLLHGPYGTGKTLSAFAAAKLCQRNGWTFIYLDRVVALKDVLIFARNYAPAVVFAEDIERAVSGGRSVKVDDILNNIDGLDSKGHEVMCIFTTNHIEQIDPAMLRPGRLDAVIRVSPPDAKAAEKLIRLYSRDLLSADADLTGAGEALKGQIPASIREAVERAKLFAISRGSKTLTGEDVRLAAIGMKEHMELAAPKTAQPSKEHRLGELIVQLTRPDYTPDFTEATPTVTH